MNLDHELQQALRRKEPPHGFEQRVRARIAHGDVVRNPAGRSVRQWAVLPIAAMLVLTLAGTYALHIREQQKAREQPVAPKRSASAGAKAELIAAERATTEVTLALQIASEKIAAIQKKVREFNHDQ